MTRRELLAAPFIYKVARPGFRYEFPLDHFSHPDFRTEWWYYTGNLTTPQGRSFGFELTFFRQALSRDQKGSSPWDVNDVYFAHLALSDLEQNRFFHYERLNRPGPGIAGASLDERRVWNGNWVVKWLDDRQQLAAVSDDFSLSFEMKAAKPPAIHGENGISQKSGGEGEASHYVSFTRLNVSGEIKLEEQKHPVAGSAWMDHEFFSHRLGGEMQGWDWFSLQFDDNTELMLYQLRRKDGSPTPFSSGTFVDQRGNSRHLKSSDFLLSPRKHWRSSASKANYPIQWQVRVPSLGVDLEVRAAMDNQELVSTRSFSPTYWEGAVRINGSRKGIGYLEMTGYDKGIDINSSQNPARD